MLAADRVALAATTFSNSFKRPARFDDDTALHCIVRFDWILNDFLGPGRAKPKWYEGRVFIEEIEAHGICPVAKR
jgi:hypothetical protein